MTSVAELHAVYDMTKSNDYTIYYFSGGSVLNLTTREQNTNFRKMFEALTKEQTGEAATIEAQKEHIKDLRKALGYDK